MTDTKWALFNDWKWYVLPVVKQTDKTVTVLDGKRERRKSDVSAVSADRAALEQAAERLTSSDALAMDERRKAADRNRERNAAIIASLS